jgi:hypothetical protein
MRLYHPQRYSLDSPIGAVVYPGFSSLADGLVFSIVSPGGPSSVYSRLDGFKGTFSGTTPPTWTPRGISFNGGSATNSYVDFGANNLPQASNLATTGFSVVARLYMKSSLGGVIERNDANTVGGGFELGFSSTNTTLVFEVTSVNYNYHISNLPPLNKFFTFVCTTPGVNDINNTHIYFDGVEQVTGRTVVIGSGTSPSDLAQGFHIGRLSFSAGGVIGPACLDGFVQWMHVYRRVLLPTEVQKLTIYPFAMYDIRSLSLVPTVAGGGGGGTSPFPALTLAP